MDAVRVVVRPHPFRDERRSIEVSSCCTVAELLEMAGLQGEHAGRAYLDGKLVPREEWSTLRPAGGQLLTARAVPRGVSSSKNGLPRFWLALTSMGTSELSRAINKWTSPDLPTFGGVNGPDRRTRPYITGARNELRPYGPVPRIFGYKVRYRPPLGARTYSTWIGNKQHFHMLFSFGYGPLYLENLKVGDTPIAALGLAEGDNMQTRRGWDDDPEIGFYLDNAKEELLAIELLNKKSDGSATSPSERRTEPGVRKIAVEVSFVNGLGEFKDNKLTKLEVEIEVEYAAAADTHAESDWQKAFGRDEAGKKNKFSGIKIKDARRAQFAVGIDWEVAEGQYDVRLRRKTADRNDFTQLDETWWTKLTSYRLGTPVLLANQCTVAIDVVATGNLTGQIDELNAEVSSLTKWYDATTLSWKTPTSSTVPTLEQAGQPAAHYLEVLTGRANRLAVSESRVDLTALAAWATATKAHGLHFSGVFESPGTVFDTLQAIAEIGRASFGMNDEKYSVVPDLDQQSLVTQHITPRNSAGFQMDREFPEPVHALRVQYRDNAVDDQLAEIVVYDDGYNKDGSGGKTAATKFETLTLIYCADKDEAWKHGRRKLFERRLRPRLYSCDMDFEAMTSRRGDLVIGDFEIFASAPRWGRVSSIALSAGDATGVTFDEWLTIDGVSSYKFRFRLSDGSAVERSVGTPAAGMYKALTFATPIPSGDPQPAVDDLFLFGPTALQFRRCIVRKMEPLSEFGWRLVLHDEASDVYTCDQTTASTATQSVTNAPSQSGASASAGIQVTTAPKTGSGSSGSAGIAVSVTATGGSSARPGRST